MNPPTRVCTLPLREMAVPIDMITDTYVCILSPYEVYMRHEKRWYPHNYYGESYNKLRRYEWWYGGYMRESYENPQSQNHPFRAILLFDQTLCFLGNPGLPKRRVEIGKSGEGKWSWDCWASDRHGYEGYSSLGFEDLLDQGDNLVQSDNPQEGK